MAAELCHDDDKLPVEEKPLHLPPTYAESNTHSDVEYKTRKHGLKYDDGVETIELDSVAQHTHHDLEPGIPHRPKKTASPLTGRRWTRRKKAIVATAALVVILLMTCSGVLIALLVRQNTSSNNIKVDPNIIVNGGAQPETLTVPTRRVLSATSTRTVTLISTAPTPTSTVFTTVTTTISASDSTSSSKAAKAPEPAIRPTESSTNTNTAKSRRDNIEVAPTIHISEGPPASQTPTSVNVSSKDNRIATITVTSTSTPTGTITTTSTIIQPIVNVVVSRTTMLKATGPRPMTTVFVKRLK